MSLLTIVGLTMSLVGSVFGIHYFKYEYSGEYSSIDDSLRRFIAASDLDSVLVRILIYLYVVGISNTSIFVTTVID